MKGSGTQRTARCPAHDDTRNSLSVAQGNNGGIVVTCHAGCEYKDILDAMSLIDADIMPSSTAAQDFTPDKKDRPQGKGGAPVAVYRYIDVDGNLLSEKTRWPDKGFSWRQTDGTSWKKGKHPKVTLYNMPALKQDIIYIVEGEKDVDTLTRLGKAAVSGPNGAKTGKWPSEVCGLFAGKYVVILPDHDAPGKAYALDIANGLHGIAKSVKLVDLADIWPEIPEHGDVTDFIEAGGDMVKVDGMASISRDYEPREVAGDVSDLLKLFKPLSEYREEEASWLIAGWIPDGQITLLASDGGVGKTSTWCDIIAALSNGSTCILDKPGTTRKPMRVMFLTTEDSVRKKLKKKLRLAGANMDNIITPDFADDRDGLLRKVKFGTPEMSTIIRSFRPELCVYDPVQGFTPPKVNMGSRNEMRDCMAPLIALGEECGATFLISCHTNKRKGAYGRDRIADSADLWDISRSVIMAGFTEDEGVRYLSNEKNNYEQLQETILFTVNDDGHVQRSGTTWKRDKEFIAGAELAVSKPKREDCKDCILQILEEADGSMKTAELNKKAQGYGYSYQTLKRSKSELKEAGKIEYFSTGSNKDKVWHTRKTDMDGFDVMPEDFPDPWKDEQTTLSPAEIPK